jgi:hypothetical protein
MAHAARIARGEIQDHMPVTGSDGRPLGTVDRVEGDFIKLMRNDPNVGGGHHWLPLSTVAGLDGGVVRLSMPAAQAESAWLDEAEVARRLTLDPDAGAAFCRPDDKAPHGSRAHAHGGPKGEREHGQSGQAAGPPGQTFFGVNRRV